MNKMIYARSLFFGLVCGAISILCLGAALKHGNQTGRFQLGVGQGETAYVIDTVSGQVWQKGDLNKGKEFLAPKAEEGKF